MTAINRTTLREQVVDKLRAAILDGTFRPGEKMAEVELAAQFGVSRGTVREAMRTLHNSGLLQGEERNSLHVRRLTGAEIAELFDVRAALEGHAVVAIMASPEHDAMIDALEARLPEIEAGLSYAEKFEVDLRFHEELCRLSGNATLLGMWTSIKDLMRVAVVSGPDESGTSLMTKAHHQPIIDAMRTGDPGRARAALAQHMAAAAEVWNNKADA
ncbi:GntR family transcriptional regulator [Raineyella fluvialis]|uniref:GntR family transcriptional regulator n=1 Tax=Raineyella fluvialis TaxID=2662261 RepID=UPI00188DD7B0|nr:GntR family transcriptional regulator [Raineyella fluvialis]